MTDTIDHGPPAERYPAGPLPQGYTRVLDHGWVGLVDVMGDDRRIVDAARLSVSGEQVRAVSDDEALIRYLMRHRHTSPFEFGELVFDMKMPMFTARQWVRHRTASISEMSARYGVLPEEFYVPQVEDIQTQSTANRQGRGVDPVNGVMHRDSFEAEAAACHGRYRARVGDDMARELARINLPLSTYTRWWWKADLHNIFHLLSLRLSPHAQMEIRVFAEVVASHVQAKFPICYRAFEDFRLCSISFSAKEIAALRSLGISVDGSFSNETWTKDLFPTKREREEFVVKVQKLLDFRA